MNPIHQLVPMLPDGTDGQMPGHEQYVLGTLALMQRDVGRHSVEIGTFTGATTTTIARATGHVVYTVDIPLGEPTRYKLGADNQKYIGRTSAFGDDVKGRIIAIRCDSAYLTLPYNLAVGFAFIDGAHTYEYCWNDFLKVEPLLVDGAVVLFHDVGVWPGVGEAVDEIVKRHAGWQWSAYGGTSLVWGRKR
jgi:predicted O-methyltransferase YrrM